MRVQDRELNNNTAVPSIKLLCLIWSQLTSERWPLRQRREHKVITFKSQRRAYVKPETIGKSAVQKERFGSRWCLCPQHICQHFFYRPLCFPHKKKINSADYQASIKYVLLTIAGISRCLVQHSGRSDRGKGHSRKQHTLTVKVYFASPVNTRTHRFWAGGVQKRFQCWAIKVVNQMFNIRLDKKWSLNSSSNRESRHKIYGLQNLVPV